VTVFFSAETKMLIYGTLIAKGTKQKKINFTGKDGAAWNGFEYFRTCGHYDTLNNNGCIFEFCTFKGVGDAPGYLIRSRGCNLKMSDCNIENCYTAVQSERQAVIYLSDNVFKGCNRPVNVRNTSIAKIKKNKFLECNSIFLGGTTDFSGNQLKKFTDNGRHSGLVIWMLGGGIVSIENNKFQDFESYAIKVQKISRRATVDLKNNSFKGNAVNLLLSCMEAGRGQFKIEYNNFFNASKSNIEIFGSCDEFSAAQKFYKIGKNYWGKTNGADFDNLKSVNINADDALKKSIRRN
jgi:hypothetical protein